MAVLSPEADGKAQRPTEKLRDRRKVLRDRWKNSQRPTEKLSETNGKTLRDQKCIPRNRGTIPQQPPNKLQKGRKIIPIVNGFFPRFKQEDKIG